MPTDPKDLPDYVRPEVELLATARSRSRTLAAGTDAVHAAGEAILPKWPGELPAFYSARSTLAEFTDFYGRTIEAALGLLFGAELAYEPDLPDALAMLDADADGRGTSLHALARRAAHGILTDGVAALLADYPRVQPDALTMRDVQDQRIRPYLVPVSASQLLSWLTARVGAETMLTQLVIAESAEVRDGQFGVRAEPRYRIYRLELGGLTVGTVRIAEQKNGDRVVEVVEEPSLVIGPTRIPLAVGYALPPEAPLVAGPPLDRLAWMNVGHYRVSADHRYLMSLCHAPTLVVTGWDGNDQSPINIGPNTVMRLTGEQKAMWLQAASDALAASERTMERQTLQMASLGMAFLSRDTSARNETATGRRMDASADRATIGTLADGVGQMLTQALAFCAQFAGDGVTAPAVTITPDYDATKLDAPTILALSSIAEKHQLTVETMLKILQDGDVLPDGLDIEEEVRAAELQRLARLVDVPEAGARFSVADPTNIAAGVAA
jgi:hypothetical protein